MAIVDNSIAPLVYKAVEHWATFLHVPFTSFRAAEGELPDLGKDFTHLILTGSEASIVEREEWVEAEVELVRKALNIGLPTLGSCYGHQLLALSLCGPAHVRRCPRPEIGWFPISILRRSGLLGEAGETYAFSSHFDEVIDLDERFEVLASTAACPIQAFALKGSPVWGIQFHPEINIKAAREYLRNLVELGLRTSRLFAAGLRTKPRDSGVIRTVVRHFLGASPGG